MALAINNARRFVVAEPLKAAWENGSQALITAAAAYMSAAFSMQHDVLPWWIAIPLSVGFEWIYLRGLATADKTNSRWATALNWAAMLTSVVYGVLYVLGHYHIISDSPDSTTAFWLALAHVIPMALISFCGASLHRAQKAESRSCVLAKQAEADRLEREAAEYRLSQQRQRDEMQMDLERQYKEAKLAAEVRAMKRTAASSVREQSANTSVQVPEVSSTASGTATNTVREQLYEQVVRTLREQPNTNKTDLARTLGIGRTLLYDIIKEAKANGEL